MISPMTAATILIKRGLVENIKDEAMKISKMYEGDLKIEINIDKDHDLVKLNIAEYNL
jgi:hypothetical protein